MRESKSRLFLCVLALATVLNIALVMAPGIALGEGSGDSDDIELVDSQSDGALFEGESDDDLYSELVYMSYPSRDTDVWAPYFDQWNDAEEGDWLIGVDVSEWNGYIDWETLSDYIDFAILRVGGSYEWQSDCYGDEQFERNASECERLGIPYGVYFYSTAVDAWDAAIEAEFVADRLEGFSPSLPVFLDLEWVELCEPESAELLTEVARTFCGRMIAADRLPGVYSSASWWEYLLTDPCFDQWAKWVAQYDGYCDVNCNCWQYDQHGEMPGFDWPVDLNVWFPRAA